LKRLLGIILLCAVAGALFYFLALRGRQTPPPEPPAETGIASAPQPAANPGGPPSPTATEAPGATSAAAGPKASTFPPRPVPPATPFLLGSAETPPPMEPATLLGNMRNTISRYASQFGENPVGTNPEITKALNGDNPKQVKFILEDSGLRINALGELVDYWGTPFFFHQISGTEMEIRSAGPDRIMYTADDLIIR
jgi:hypothetical protein